MGRANREDEPGMWHHVFNRGLARRPVFESRAIARFFLSRIACAVRRGEIEVHAFALMATHFHLLVRSPKGELSIALRRVESEFVRWFNVVRDRDGALFRGRFGSRPAREDDDRRIVVRYIDQNLVVAGMVERPEDYPYGSAALFLKGRRPPWLTRTWLDQDLDHWLRQGMGWRAAYRRAYADRPLTEDGRFVVESRMQAPTSPRRECHDLLSWASDVVRSRFERDRLLADGTAPGWPVVGPNSVTDALTAAWRDEPDWRIGHASTNAWRLVVQLKSSQHN